MTSCISFLSVIIAILGVASAVRAAEIPDCVFDKIQISDKYIAEGAGIGDLNLDGNPDVVVPNKKWIFAFQQTESANRQVAQVHTAPRWPQVKSVESQPLLAQVKRLKEAMTYIGSPLPDDVTAAFEDLDTLRPDDEVSAAVQAALDPHCLAAVVLEGGKLQTIPGSARPQLLQEGWRTFLVKVVSKSQLKSALSVSSPNAGDKPGALADQAEQRWMEVSMYDGRPLTPRLSGLDLEYRVLQIYSSEAGQQSGTIEFHVSGATADDPTVIAEWTFDDDLGGWEALTDSQAEVQEGVVTLTNSEQQAVHFQTDVAPPNPSGLLELRIWMTASSDAGGTVFWANGPVEKADFGQAPFTIKKGSPRDYRVIITAEDPLSAMRIVVPHNSQIDWIRLARPGHHPTSPASLAMTFDCVAATPITLRVFDELGQPTTAAFLIRGEDGQVYPTQSKRLAPDFFFHPQVYRADGESVALPPGEYTIQCSRGPESIPETKQLAVGEEPTEIVYRVERWVDPAARGWYSGDHHIHAAGCAHYQNPTQGVHALDMARHIIGEDLKVGCNLTWGPCFDYQKQFFTGKVADASQYPYLLRYDVEVSGFGSHVSGHLCLLRLKEQIYPGGDSKDHWPTLGLNTLKWAKAQGAVCGPAHASAGLQVTDVRVDGEDGPPLPGWKGFNFPTWKTTNNLPNYSIPAYDGIGANEFIVDITHNIPGPDGTPVPAVDFISSMNTDRVAEWNMWYHTLNCGFRVKTSGETDFPCVTGDRVGIGRVYVKVKDRLDYDDWCQGISEGRSYVSDGSAHLFDLVASHRDQSVPLGENGSELRLNGPGKVTLTLDASVRKPDQQTVDIELIHNAYPVAKQTIATDGTEQSVTFDVGVTQSGWLAVRAGGSAHTNPIFVIVDGQPIRASVASAEWCLKGVDQCWSTKQKTYAKDEQQDAKAAYVHASDTYRRILKEAQTVADSH